MECGEGWRLDSDPKRNSLRLLPSGPDRVGEGSARRQPPRPISLPGRSSATRRRETPQSAAEVAGLAFDHHARRMAGLRAGAGAARRAGHRLVAALRRGRPARPRAPRPSHRWCAARPGKHLSEFQRPSGRSLRRRRGRQNRRRPPACRSGPERARERGRPRSAALPAHYGALPRQSRGTEPLPAGQRGARRAMERRHADSALPSTPTPETRSTGRARGAPTRPGCRPGWPIPQSQALAFWNGAPLVTTAEGGVRLARLPADLALKVADTEQDLLFLGTRGRAGGVRRRPRRAGRPGGRAAARLRHASAGCARLTPLLAAEEAAQAATARAVFEWRRRHRFCANCGQPSLVTDGGWRRQCPACSAEHFPRTDPVVIMLPIFGDRCLLGPPGELGPGPLFGAGRLPGAGRIDRGGLRARGGRGGGADRSIAVRYHSSQPWPYPSNLMIGLFAEVSDDQAAPDQTELEAARWFDKAEARACWPVRSRAFRRRRASPSPTALIQAWSNALSGGRSCRLRSREGRARDSARENGRFAAPIPHQSWA